MAAGKSSSHFYMSGTIRHHFIFVIDIILDHFSVTFDITP